MKEDLLPFDAYAFRKAAAAFSRHIAPSVRTTMKGKKEEQAFLLLAIAAICADTASQLLPCARVQADEIAFRTLTSIISAKRAAVEEKHRLMREKKRNP